MVKQSLTNAISDRFCPILVGAYQLLHPQLGESGLFEQNRQLYAGTMPAKTREERILTASYPTATLKTGIYGHVRAVCCVSSQRPSR